jgi:hypothetical protein
MAAMRRDLMSDLAGRSRWPSATDFNACSLCFRRADQTGGNVTLDLQKLILVDRLFVATILGAIAAQRPEHGEDRRGRHQREHKPQHHPAVPAERRELQRALRPLYTTGRVRGN